MLKEIPQEAIEKNLELKSLIHFVASKNGNGQKQRRIDFKCNKCGCIIQVIVTIDSASRVFAESPGRCWGCQQSLLIADAVSLIVSNKTISALFNHV